MAPDCRRGRAERARNTGAWTGAAMAVWGGRDAFLNSFFGDGALYDPISNVWMPLPTSGAPTARGGHVLGWTGSRLVVWGGGLAGATYFGNGAIFDPTSTTWTPIASIGAPQKRDGAAFATLNGHLGIWGGYDSGAAIATGGIYRVQSNDWLAISASEAPSRRGAPGVWIHVPDIPIEMFIVWGGDGGYMSGIAYGDGARLNTANGAWSAVSTLNAPAARAGHTMIVAGKEIVVWGGHTKDGAHFADGGRYDPAADVWTIIPADAAAPSPRESHSAVWTGTEMVVWGGCDAVRCFSNGGRFNPSTRKWTPIAADGAPAPRRDQVAVWTGVEILVWGGCDPLVARRCWNDGGRWRP